MDSMCIYTLKGGKGIGETAVDEIEIGENGEIRIYLAISLFSPFKASISIAFTKP